jgi:hypothetical protein
VLAPVAGEVAQEPVGAELEQTLDRARVLRRDPPQHLQHVLALLARVLEVEPLQERPQDGQMTADIGRDEQAVVQLERERRQRALPDVQQRVAQLRRERPERRPGRAVVRHPARRATRTRRSTLASADIRCLLDDPQLANSLGRADGTRGRAPGPERDRRCAARKARAKERRTLPGSRPVRARDKARRGCRLPAAEEKTDNTQKFKIRRRPSESVCP